MTLVLAFLLMFGQTSCTDYIDLDRGTAGGSAKGFGENCQLIVIRRSPGIRRQFQKSHPCPSTGKRYGACPRYVVDHVRPLACGGTDSTGNMQWQTVQAAKLKDKWERKGC